MKQNKLGICQRIASAQSVEELSSLMQELGGYEWASRKTFARARRLAAKSIRRIRGN